MAGAQPLSQNEYFSLNKQRNLKIKLKNTIQNLDAENSGLISFEKFQIECLDLGIKLGANDIENIVMLYEDTSKPDLGYLMLDYTKAISNLVPVLRKNSDIIGASNFKIGWSLSQNAKQRATFAKS